MGLNCMNSYEENEMCKLGAKVQFCAKFALRKTGARLFFAQIKACAVHKAQSFALHSQYSHSILTVQLHMSVFKLLPTTSQDAEVDP